MIYNVCGYYDKIKDFFDVMVKEKFVNSECNKLFVVFDKKEQVIEYLSSYSADDIVWNILKK